MTTSGMILVACCIVVAIADLIAERVYGIRGTVSWYVRNQMILHPSLILALGVLIGHFIAGMEPPKGQP